MKLFMCFGGAAAAAAVIDDEAAEVAARHLQAGQRRRRGRRSLSFRGKFLPGYKGGNAKKPSLVDQPKKRGMDADDVAYGVSRTSSSVASSALLSSATSLDSDTSASSSASSSRSSTASSSPSVSGVLYPGPVNRQASSNTKRSASSPAAGAAAVVLLCLLMVVLCGRVGATLLTSTALYLFPRRWPARTTRKEKRGAVVDSLECDAEEEETAKRKVVVQGSSVRNRNK